ncbi:MAG: type I 3-dehydroquinate dehydratase [Bacteroidales bacterium]|jgi:3-dehydroquinate dehydratase type I|nr:type I 3-dehydroquinate dehydratase [Bacteroidales bacterium]
MTRPDMQETDGRICVSIGEAGFAECMQLAARLPLVEIRLDLMQLDPGKIELLSLHCRQWIATCRPGSYTEHDRMVQLSAAVRAGATYIDIEYEAEAGYRKALTELAKRLGTQVIVSYHDFSATPDTGTLNGIIERSVEMGADWVKIAVTARSHADAARIMSLYGQDRRLIAFAMGRAGRITRIAAPLLGAPFTFAAIDETRPTAPGQLTAAQMKMIFGIMDQP